MKRVTRNNTISFEFFPPKTQEGAQQLLEATSHLAFYAPEFFSVTFGAGGSTRSGTIETVKQLQAHTAIPVTPHLACLGLTQSEMTEVLMQYRALGAKQIVALRGDVPLESEPHGDYLYASELIEAIRANTGDYFEIAVAAYPEFHPQAISPTEDILNLKRKYLAGANKAITQYFYNADAYFYYLDDCAKAGISLPIIPGIMPITQFARLARFSDMCGAEIPLWLRKRLQAYEHNPEALQQFGLEFVHDLCERLLIGGAPGLHFYTLNKAEAVIALLQQLQIMPIREKKIIGAGTLAERFA